MPSQPIERGQRVRIPKGTPLIYATSPRMKDSPTVVKRTHTVKVHDVSGPYDTPYRHLWWAGAGGYWRVVHVTPELLAANGIDA